MKTDEYTTAHLVVAAIRLHSFLKNKPPLVEDVAGMLSFSVEQGHMLCRELHRLGIVEMVEGAYGPRLFVKNHLAIEELPREEKTARLDDAVKAFKTARSDFDEKVASIKAKQEKKQKDLFAKLQEELKKNK